MPKLSHGFRPNAFAKERVYSLGPDGIDWKDDESDGQIPYAEIDHLRLMRPMSRTAPNLKQCNIHIRSGPRFKLTSAHFNSQGEVEDRSASYGPFVKELLRRAATANPSARFVAGSTIAWMILLVAFISFATMFVAGVFAILGGRSIPIAGYLWFVAVMTFLVPLWWLLRVIRPARDFNPIDPPKRMLSG